jgi:hypothetical protein
MINYCLDCKKIISRLAKRCRRCASTGRKLSEVAKLKISAKRNGRATFRGKQHTEISKLKMSEVKRGKKNNFYGKSHSEEVKQRLSQIAMAYWQKPEYIQKQMQIHKVKINRAELKLNDLLQQILPNEYKYVGDGEFIIAGKCPDFLNINGKKKLIELWGNHWHSNHDPQKRINIFRPFGFDTLIIWESELKNTEFTKGKILAFNNQ